MARRNGESVDSVKANGTAVFIVDDNPAPIRIVSRQITAAIVEAPLSEAGTGYVSQHVEVRFGQNESRQAETLKRLVDGLRDTREKLANGRDVKTTADAVRWLLEKLSAE
jgi:hypothetical protein